MLPFSGAIMSYSKPLLLMSETCSVFVNFSLVGFFNVEFKRNSKINNDQFLACLPEQTEVLNKISDRAFNMNSGGFAFGEFFDVTQNFKTIVRMASGGDCLADVLKTVIVAPGKPSLSNGDGAMIEDMVKSGSILTQAAFVEGFSPSLTIDLVVQCITYRVYNPGFITNSQTLIGRL